MRPFRSGVLGALLAIACIPGIDALPRMEERLRETLMSAILKWAPDLAPEATLELLLVDVKATYGVTGHTYESAADALVDLLREWANNGRAQIVLRDEAVAGEWRARLLFDGPGNYRTELYKRPGERWATYLVPTQVQAWDLAVKEAKERAGRVTTDGDTLTPAMIRRAASEMDKNSIPKDPDGMYRLPHAPPAEPVRFPSIPQIMSYHHPAMTRREPGPVDFKRAGEESRARRVVVAGVSGQVGYLEVGPDGWRSSAPVIKRRNRPAKSRDERDEQAADRKARARKKARRGW